MEEPAPMAKLTSKDRNSLPTKDFAEPKDRKYPLPDRSHAQNALARSSGKPIAAEVRRKVEAKFPGLVKGKKK